MTNSQRIIQAAGVRDPGEARLLAACGFTHVGLPLRLPVHRPDCSEEQARDICGVLARAGVESVCITYVVDPAEALELCRFLGCRGLQLHGAMPLEAVQELRRAAPGLYLIKSLVLGAGRDEAELAALARRHAPFVDAFLTDTFDPATGASGATGKTHDWAVSRRLAEGLAEGLARPLILAGGLTAANVARAIGEARPWGVDAHTGLEGPDGAKDEGLCRAFVRESQRGFDALP